jgi:hypothetical protein
VLAHLLPVVLLTPIEAPTPQEPPRALAQLLRLEVPDEAYAWLLPHLASVGWLTRAAAVRLLYGLALLEPLADWL